ncbi:DUF262 domain-containing protein [Salinimonas iocasae]|uniref:DUF262 domain-containing protein n=1 Tax=Salinimonas iocasae TaxID=2572577 RepID=A0A5B7YGA3_9ALTE|nr:DUF262 domain-containing protein [Salinimonas iocasae]QCZ94370.1 DUF262 domain-containing protein [Salinimonas iocasae]
MKIEADDKEIQDIFSLGYFKIPRFQRPYSWELDEVESFWNDITSEADANYFIGSMVVYQTRRPYFGIVDGQQRLTTITLLLSAIRNGFIKLGEENLAKGVHKYIEKANIDNEDEFVVKAETSFPYLQAHIQTYNGSSLKCDVGNEEKKLEVAYKLLNKKLVEHVPELSAEANLQPSLFTNHEADPVVALKELRDKVLSLKLVFIQLDSEEDAYLIFETLNARGRDLTTADLIKNLILKKLKTKSSILDLAKESWNTLVKRLDDVNDEKVLDTFLLHYWLSKHGYTTDKKLFSEVKAYIGASDVNAQKLVEQLNESSYIYRKAIQPRSVRWEKIEYEVRDSLTHLRAFKVKQQSSMVLALLRAHEKKVLKLRGLKKALDKIVAFHYAFNAVTSQRSSGSISTNYSRIACQLSHAEGNDDIQHVFNELNSFLKSKFPAKEEFLVKFQELEYLDNKTKHKPIIVYALKILMSGVSNGLSVDYKSLTIEHLIPQSSNQICDSLVGSIGNLLLVDSKTNSEDLKDYPPQQKIQILRGKSYPISTTLLNIDEINETKILDRGRLIAETVYEKLHATVFR